MILEALLCLALLGSLVDSAMWTLTHWRARRRPSLLPPLRPMGMVIGDDLPDFPPRRVVATRNRVEDTF